MLKAMLWGKGDLYDELNPLYEKAVKEGRISIEGYALKHGKDFALYLPDGTPTQHLDAQIAIVSENFGFHHRVKELAAYGVAKNNVIDGRVFRVQELDVARLCLEGIGYGAIYSDKTGIFVCDASNTVYPRVYTAPNFLKLNFGTKSYCHRLKIESRGTITIGKYTGMAWDIVAELGIHSGHNPGTLSNFGSFDWSPGFVEFPPGKEYGALIIGSDVWVGRGVRFKATDHLRPLTIGDGAVVAADSVVVKSVPPYAMVGGNPAKIIRYRFPEKIIEKLQRIRWWDWEPEKIEANFAYFKDAADFAARFDTK
ncbi:MAG: hypothetical protein IJ849_09035 [Selenomonadaceae bacterium]|nr:hypothetical protein [Selenomonadaceae bacterium]